MIYLFVLFDLVNNSRNRYAIRTFRFFASRRTSLVISRFFAKFLLFASSPRRLMNTPPKRQLFVTFRGSYPRDERDVEVFFKNYPRQKFHIKLLKNHDAAFVNFEDIRDAKDAFQRVHHLICRYSLSFGIHFLLIYFSF